MAAEEDGARELLRTEAVLYASKVSMSRSGRLDEGEDVRLCSAAVLFAASREAAPVPELEMSEALQRALGVLFDQDGAAHPNLTRAQFVALGCRLFGMELVK